MTLIQAFQRLVILGFFNFSASTVRRRLETTLP